jgi:hypothetical protein
MTFWEMANSRNFLKVAMRCPCSLNASGVTARAYWKARTDFGFIAVYHMHSNTGKTIPDFFWI